MAEKKHPVIRNKMERTLVYMFLLATVVMMGYEYWIMTKEYSGMYSSRHFNQFFRHFGSYARLALFVVIAHYAFKLVLQKQWVPNEVLKRLAVTLSKLARRLHTPFAVLAIGLILVHAVGALLQFQFDFNNITGLLALLVLLPIPISGFLRYKKLDRKWHLRLGITFIVLFFVHAFL